MKLVLINLSDIKMTKLLFKVIVALCFMIISNKTFAQKDLIITQAGEEIRCKILDETPTRFVYAYLGPKNKVLRNEIFKNLVSDFTSIMLGS